MNEANHKELDAITLRTGYRYDRTSASHELFERRGVVTGVGFTDFVEGSDYRVPQYWVEMDDGMQISFGGGISDQVRAVLDRAYSRDGKFWFITDSTDLFLDTSWLKNPIAMMATGV